MRTIINIKSDPPTWASDLQGEAGMDTLWILVAQEAGARIFKRNRPSEGMRLLEQIDHPAGRLKDHDIIADRPGRAFSPAGRASGPQTRHGYGASNVSVHEQESVRFSQELAILLDTARAQNRFSQLILVAGPEEMGRLNGALHKQTLERVIGRLNKNLGKVRDIDMEDQLLELLSDADSKLAMQGSA